MFDIFNFLKYYNIPIPDESKSTGTGWVNIQCPFCFDQKNHLGYNYQKEFWHCWKCRKGYHSTSEVIQKLLPYENVHDIMKRFDTIEVASLELQKKLNVTSPNKIILPGENLKQIHQNYLIHRGFNPDFLEKKYKIKGCLHLGQYKYRLIFPVFFKKKLVSFQTRSINNSNPRYINCEPEKEVIPMKNILYNYDNCNEKYIIVTEGIFKVFRLGKNSCATFGKNYNLQQLNLLSSFQVVFIFFDPDIYGQEKAKKLNNELDSLGIRVYNIVHQKAPDDLTKFEAKKVKDEIKNIFNKKVKRIF